MAKRVRERKGQPHGYIFKLKMRPRQHEELMRQARMVAQLWNALLQRNEDVFRRTRGQKNVVHLVTEKSHLSSIDMSYEISALRQECPEWRELSTWTPRRVADALDEAYKHFFRRMKELSNPASYEAKAAEFKARKGRNPTRYELAGYPRYRSVRKADWIPHRLVSGCALRPHSLERERPGGRKSFCNWRLRLKGVEGELIARGEFPQQPLDWLNADLRCRDGAWWLAVSVETKPERAPGKDDITVRFDLIDAFSLISTPCRSWTDMPNFRSVLQTQDRIDALQSERDRRWPYKPGRPQSLACQEMSRRIRRMQAHVARARREALHKWTTDLVASAARLTIIAPPVKAKTRSAKGHEKDWGGAVDLVASLNRHVLSQSPAMTVNMLKYKAAEAGIECVVTDDDAPSIAVGGDLSKAKKLSRKAGRKLHKEAA